MFLGSGEEETEMDVNYVFLCGVMWCRFGQQDAGKELLRATNSVDPDCGCLHQCGISGRWPFLFPLTHFALTFDQKSSAWSAVLVSSHTLCRLLPGCDFHCRRFGIELVAP